MPRADELPSWLTQPQNYVALHDKDRFLRRNTLKLASVLSNLKLQRGGLLDGDRISMVDRALGRVDPAFRLFGLILSIVLVSLAVNMLFVYVMLGVLLVMLAVKPADQLADIMKPAFAACLLTAVLMLPAAFLGQPGSLARVACKVFVSVGLAIQLSRTVAYNQLIAAFDAYHIPDMVVFILDIALKYIVLLGDVAINVLESLTLRSVGRNEAKSSSASGVMGVTFLKAHDFAGEMYEAMECRGFTGEYEVPKRRRISPAAIAYLAALALEFAVFLSLEGAI